MSLLDFLVTSNNRRDLLHLLWRENLQSSGHQLARLLGASYSSVHKELASMQNEGLVTSRPRGKAVMFKKNENYASAEALDALLEDGHRFQPSHRTLTDDQVRLNLAKFGAPLAVHGETTVDLTLEETLASALALARRDSTVARVLPVAFAKNRHSLDMRRLEFLARQTGVLRVLGLFLDLTGSLMNSKALHTKARRLKDRRVKRFHDFFESAKSNSFERALAEANTPSVARQWNFLMNMGMDSFESSFKKSFPEGSPA